MHHKHFLQNNVSEYQVSLGLVSLVMLKRVPGWQNKVELDVALKTLKEDSSDEDKVRFLQEAAIMAQFKHPNIVILHGVVSDKQPVHEKSYITT